jgi:hypothetical protein
MLAARADQENTVHAHQTAAAAKPLNHGIKGLAAKTPGNRAPKTPFKIPLNDENAAIQPGKSVLKTNGKEKALTVKKDAFVTPAGESAGLHTRRQDGRTKNPSGPRTRAPLGAKTTNARGNAFQTPAPQSVQHSPEKSQLKTVSPRLRRAKVKIHQAEEIKNEEVEEREIEYMPPKPIRAYTSSFSAA